MKNFKPCFEKTKTGDDVTIRSARISDAQSTLELAQAIVAEDVFQLMTSIELQITLASEEEWIGSFIATPHRIILVAEMVGQIVGLLDFCNGHRNRIAHTGEFGMHVAKEFRERGVGTLLVKSLIDWASANGRIEKIGLSVHSDNLPAITLYKKMGFEIEGVKKKELKYSLNHYVDTIIMSRFVK